MSIVSPYFQIPNSIIHYACSNASIPDYNPMLLPVFLYSAVNMQYHNQYKVDTNLSLIASTFDYSNSQAWKHARDALKILYNGYNITVPLSNGKLREISIPPSIDYKMHIDNVSKTDRIEYYFLARAYDYKEGSNLDGYTTFYHHEYNYLIDQISYANPESPNNINLIDLLTIYCYLKSRIQYYSNLSQRKGEFIHYSFNQTLDTISNNIGLGKSIVTRSINYLQQIGLIDFIRPDTGQRNARIYILSDKWKSLI